MVAWRNAAGGHQDLIVMNRPFRTRSGRLSDAWCRMYRMSAEPVELPPYAERVLDVADRIPPGRVMTYGDVAEWLGEGGPRQVGRVMSLYGGTAPWWRVVRADGTLLPGHEMRALGHYRAESTPLKEASRAARETGGHIPRLDMRRARWDGGDEAHV